LFHLPLLNFFGDFERKNLIGVFFYSIFEISQRFSTPHFESIEFFLGFIELTANILEIVLGMICGRHSESLQRKTTFYQNSNELARAISPPF